MILHFVRHPAPDIEPGVCYGQLDVAARNVAETAERLQRTLPACLPVWSSPLRRCRELAERLHPAPQFDARLMEMNFGTWEGRPWAAIPRSEIDAWAADVVGYTVPGGESVGCLQRRVRAWIGGVAAEEVVVIAHAGVMRVLLQLQEAARPGGPPPNQVVGFGEVHRLVFAQ